MQWSDAVTRVKKLKNFRAKSIVIFEKILAVKILHFHEFSILTFWKADKGILGFPKYLEFERHQKCNRVADIYVYWKIFVKWFFSIFAFSVFPEKCSFYFGYTTYLYITKEAVSINVFSFLGEIKVFVFVQFVVNKEGVPVYRSSPTDDPIPKVEEAIKKCF